MHLRNALPNLDKIIQGELRSGYTILIAGEEGTLKTVFTFSLLNGLLARDADAKGIFVTLDEDLNDHIWNMKSLGIEPHKNLKVSDIAKFRASLWNAHPQPITDGDYFDLIMRAAKAIRGLTKEDEKNVSRSGYYALDSLNALLSHSHIPPNETRIFMQKLFYKLKQNMALSLIIWEKTDPNREPYYLADGVIELGIIEQEKKEPKRYMQVKKMRGVKHSLKKFMIEGGDKGVEILAEIVG